MLNQFTVQKNIEQNLYLQKTWYLYIAKPIKLKTNNDNTVIFFYNMNMNMNLNMN